MNNGMNYHVLPVPDEVVLALREKKVRRLLAKVNGQSTRRALQTHADGGGYLLFGQDALAELGLRLGSVAAVEVEPDPEPDAFDMPEELRLALEQDEDARTRWETFTPGRKRSLVHYVNSAKQEATRIRRACELARKIRTHTLHGDA